MKTMPLPSVEVQWACEALPSLPDADRLAQWAREAARAAGGADGEITLRLVDEPEMRELNHSWRHKDGPTNVLSFPFDMPEGLPEGVVSPVIGDIVICAAVVAREAHAQGKTVEAHWAHMVVHGVLHLLGHDHERDDEAAIMESLETATLAALGYNDPYGDSITAIRES